MTVAMNSIPSESDVDVYVARQPIFDRALNVVGYELLFRDGPENRARIEDPEAATAQLLLNVFSGIGLDRLVGDSRAFVNLPRGFLVGDYPLPQEPGRLTLEVLEDVPIDETLVRGLENLAAAGFTIALDDVIFESRLRMLLLGVASIVKLDLRRLPRDQWAAHVREFRKCRVQILAEKVETEEELDACIELGFDLFQGYFLSRPTVIRGSRPSSSQAALLQLLARISDPAATVDDLERVFRSDAGLSYSLLRLVNSSFVGLSRRTESIRQAIVMVGFTGIRTLALLAVVSRIPCRTTEALLTPIRRALLCEKLSRRLGEAESGSAFVMGLVSGLEMLLRIPLESILEMLPLSDKISSAIVRHDGTLGEILLCALAHEEGAAKFTGIGLPTHQVTEAFLASIEESQKLLSADACFQSP